MNKSSGRHEAQRWLDTAAEDLRAAHVLAEAGFHGHACFFAQQCAEKSVKAAWRRVGTAQRESSVQRLIEEFPMKDRLDGADALVEKAAMLDRYYIPTRYPNGLPDLTPEQTYFAADSQQAIGLAGDFLQNFCGWIETWS